MAKNKQTPEKGRVAAEERVWAVADEDLERATEEKTSAVHFLRFELSEASCRAAKSGASIAIGSDHAHYSYQVDPLAEALRVALSADLD